MQIDENSESSKKISVLKTVALLIIWGSTIGITANYVRNQNAENATGKDIIRCVIDENASDLNSPACKRVIKKCSNDQTGFCKKLLFYSDDGVHSEEILSMLGNICSKGGEKACDILINRCIENSSNCEILGKSYIIKNYLAMKSSAKNTGKSVMYKKLKNYYDKDVDNIVDSVIQTCMTDKNSMACQIFTSKTYEFNSAEKPYFVIIQNTSAEAVFNKIGLSLQTSPVLPVSVNKKDEEVSSVSVNPDKNHEDTTQTENPDVKPEKKLFPIFKKDKTNNLQADIKNKDGNPDKPTLEVPVNTDLASNIPDKNIILQKKQPEVLFKSLLTTGEDNNIDYIKNKIYSFYINYKEPANTKIRWLVSFDGRATWEKWDGTGWIQVNTDSGFENINFSAIGNTSAEIIKGLKDYTLPIGEASLDFAVELMSTEENLTPSVDRVEVKYY